MRKILVSLISIFLFQSTSALWLDTLLLECIAAHNKAFLELEAHRDQIDVTDWTQYVYGYNSTIIISNYHYSFSSTEAKKSLLNYQAALDALSGINIINSTGDGFILGLFAGLINRAFTNETCNKKELTGLALAIIAATIVQQYIIDETPYFSYYTLKKYSNFFSCFDPNSITRIFYMFLGTSVGHLGADYIVSKCID